MMRKTIDIQYFYKISIFALIIYVFVLTLFYGNDVDLKPFNYILVLVINALCLLRVRRNIYYLIVFVLIFYFDYSIIYPNYIHHIDSFFTRGINDSVTNISINLLCIFSGMLYIIIPQKINKTEIGYTHLSSTRVLYQPFQYVVLMILIAIFLFGISRPSEIGERSNPSPVYEYSVMIFIVSFYFIKSKRIKAVFAFLCFLSACQCFIYGGRVSGIQNLMCLYIFFFAHRISFLRIVVYSLPLFFLMLLIGSARASLMQGNFSIENIFLGILESGGALDTCYAAYQTSQIFVFAESRIADGFIYFLSFFVSIFSGFLPPEMSVQKIADRFYDNYNGGVFPYYFYFYGRLIGVVLSSLIIYLYFKLMNSLTEKGKVLSKCLSIFFICTIFRWYLYTPLVLLRGSLFLTIVYYIFYIFSSKKNKEVTHTIHV